MHTPLMAAITGLLLASTASMTCSRCGSAACAGVLNSRMSAPPENTLPVPVITTTLTFGSLRARCRPPTMPRRIARFSPLTGGLSICSTATSPRRSK
jgi:hypothetical protein